MGPDVLNNGVMQNVQSRVSPGLELRITAREGVTSGMQGWAPALIKHTWTF